MNYEIEVTDHFKKEAKKLIRKYPSLNDEMIILGKQIEQNPTKGTLLGNNVYKIRLSISSKGKGKSGGARIISFLKIFEQKVFLISIYDKSEKANLSNKEIEMLLRDSQF